MGQHRAPARGRTPGYPLFLAACQAVFGERPLPVRLIQAALGTGSVWLVYRLTQEVDANSGGEPGIERRCCNTPLWAAALTAFNPYYAAMLALILSEALFTPLMLLCLCCLAALLRPVDEKEHAISQLPTFCAARWLWERARLAAPLS